MTKLLAKAALIFLALLIVVELMSQLEVGGLGYAV